MATNLPSCFFIQFLEQLLKFLVNFVEIVKSQRSCGCLITKELIFGFQILDLKDHFSAFLNAVSFMRDFTVSRSDCEVSERSVKDTLNYSFLTHYI